MFKIALNAGHGLYTAGKRCLKELDPNQTREWALNSRICEKIQKILREYSEIEVLRLDDISGKTDIALRSRTNTANSWSANFYLAIHHNAGIYGGTGGGIETYIFTKASKESEIWQSDLYDSLIKHTQLKGNRLNGKRKQNLHEVRESNMPAVLIECGFMDSATDVPIILSEDFANKVASACCEVIIKKTGVVKKEATIITPKENQVLRWQKAAIEDGFNFPKYGADGIWGSECISVARQAICKKRGVYLYYSLTKIVQEKVGVTQDGKFGNNTKNAVVKFQKDNGLNPDGCVGVNTWKKILEV